MSHSNKIQERIKTARFLARRQLLAGATLSRQLRSTTRAAVGLPPLPLERLASIRDEMGRMKVRREQREKEERESSPESSPEPSPEPRTSIREAISQRIFENEPEPPPKPKKGELARMASVQL